MSKINLNEFKNLIKKNEKVISKNIEKIQELNTISTENRAGRIVILSELAFLPSTFLICLLKLVPQIYAPITNLGVILLFGTIGNFVFENKFNLEKRVKKVSNAKNETEREEEIFKCELENEKLNNMNKVLSSSISSIDREESALSQITRNGRYIVKCKNEDNEKDSLEKKNEELESRLSTKYQKLDELSSKSFFKKKRNSIHNNLDIAFYSMCSGMMVSFAMVLSILMYGIGTVPMSPLIPLTTLFGSFIASMGVCTSILSSKRKKQKNILKKYIKDEENLDVEDELEKEIEEISHIQIDLEENKQRIRKLDNRVDTTKIEERSYEPHDTCVSDISLDENSIKEEKAYVKRKK